MAIKRVWLLFLGIAGSAACALLLVFAVQAQLHVLSLEPDCIEEPSTDPYDYLGMEIQDVDVLPLAQIQLPTVIEGTTLIAQRLAAYDGPFLEDGSDREVVNVAALVVYNAGQYEILKAEVILAWGELLFRFYGENIPPGETVLLLEQNCRSCLQTNFTACMGWQITSNENQEPNAYVQISDSAMGAVTVTSISENTLRGIRLYYKSWLSPPDIYVGGISRMIEIPVLPAGESVTLYPPYYACNYTKIVSISIDGI
ncbi:MAG: hypothetical protein IJB47_01130 [Oscillospiraceae bacterium]|nr:hypothetical protein [Oscillospiraceae bacterium]